MLADQAILQLSKVALQFKDLLPQYAGIYYVVDENNTVWYIGQAKNICKRWQGKSHHRIYQLEAQKKKNFTIYYQQVSESQLDAIEKQRIEKYRPHLNSSPVKTKQVRPTETLLRETIAAISDFAFILGVEPPRKEIESQIYLEWLKQKKILGLSVIHICIDTKYLRKQLNLDTLNQQDSIIKKSFINRKVYANKWGSFSQQYPLVYRLLVNGYAIEVHYWNWWSSQQESEEISADYETTLAGESIKSLTPESLQKIQNQFEAIFRKSFDIKRGLHRLTPRVLFQYKKYSFDRLKPYDTDLMKLIFNEVVDSEVIKSNMDQIIDDYKTGKRGVGSRSLAINSKPINADFTTIEELLIYREIDPEKYNKEGIINLDVSQEKMGLFIKCFSADFYQEYYQLAYEIVNNQKVITTTNQLDTIYLLAGVDKKAWLLVEEYLKDFALVATTELNNGVGYLKKFHISYRKYLVPAKVNIKLENMAYSAWIPFGFSEDFPSFDLAKKEISQRLNDADLPALKLAFKKETIGK